LKKMGVGVAISIIKGSPTIAASSLLGTILIFKLMFPFSVIIFKGKSVFWVELGWKNIMDSWLLGSVLYSLNIKLDGFILSMWRIYLMSRVWHNLGHYLLFQRLQFGFLGHLLESVPDFAVLYEESSM
jgi:hypothetical protein